MRRNKFISSSTLFIDFKRIENKKKFYSKFSLRNFFQKREKNEKLLQVLPELLEEGRHLGLVDLLLVVVIVIVVVVDRVVLASGSLGLLLGPFPLHVLLETLGRSDGVICVKFLKRGKTKIIGLL